VAILLVEDDAGDAERTLHALREASPASEVHWVKDGAEALDFLFCSGR
jgi:two-component system response regulator